MAAQIWWAAAAVCLAVLVHLVTFSVKWGKMTAQQDERHRENKETMEEIRDDQKEIKADIKHINGRVAANSADIDWLKGRRRGS